MLFWRSKFTASVQHPVECLALIRVQQMVTDFHISCLIFIWLKPFPLVICYVPLREKLFLHFLSCHLLGPDPWDLLDSGLSNHVTSIWRLQWLVRGKSTRAFPWIFCILKRRRENFSFSGVTNLSLRNQGLLATTFPIEWRKPVCSRWE